jgi:SRSO17 transposase
MTPQEIAEVRPRLLGFAAEMFGGLAGRDQRAAGELYVRGLLTDGQRKPMVPMAARLGTDHQRLQQFITSSTWDYVAVRRNVARWFAASQLVEALVVDDTGFPKGRGGVAVRGPAVLRDAGQDWQLPDRGERAPGERAFVVRGGLAAVLPAELGRRRAG